MKKYTLIIALIALLLTSCSSANKIYLTQDDIKNQSTIKLNQRLKGYSDESRQRRNKHKYTLTFKHFFAQDAEGSNTYTLDVKLVTRVRAYEIEPRLYLTIDGELIQIDSDTQITKMYQQGSSSTSSETSTSTSPSTSSDGEEGASADSKTTTTSTTSYTTTSSHDTFQLMQLRFNPETALLKKMRRADAVRYRLYFDKEIIDVPLRKKEKRRFQQYVDMLPLK